MEGLSELHAHCHVNQNTEGDRFVGIRADSGGVMVHFPIGYGLPGNEQDLRQDILHLITVLAEFTDSDAGVLNVQDDRERGAAGFPIGAYMQIIQRFMEQNSYYMESEPVFQERDRGKVDWPKTLRQKRPLIQSNGTPAYTKYIVRVSSPNENYLITQIHKYCVYESFAKLGWLFTAYLPESPEIRRDDKLFLALLREKLANTYNDRDKRLFSAMISMIEYMDTTAAPNSFYFGTDRFEYIWEKLIDNVFGIKNKADYFPKTRWMLRVGKKRTNAALEPDTIMLYDGKIYVLDAKYYRFGITGRPGDLPESSSINKQITYGEYIHTRQCLQDQNSGDIPIYNAFLMPYNALDNPFGSTELLWNIGEARGDWKHAGYFYERIQGIVVDIRALMHHYTGASTSRMAQLARAIESAFDDGGQGTQPQ